MATNFPGSQDSLTNPTSSDTLDSPDHAAQHTNVNDAVEAIELALLDGAPLKIDDTNERVGIGTTSPVRLLHIYEGASGVTSQNGAADLIIESDDQAGISFNTPNTGTGYLRFIDPDANAQGGLSYAHSTDKLSLRTSGSDKVVIDSSGLVQIQDGSESTPSLTFVSDTNTGLYAHAADEIGFTAGGSEVARLGSFGFRGPGSGDLYNWDCIRGDSQAATEPTFSFTADTNTGMFRHSENSIGFATGGAQRTLIHNNGDIYHSYQIRVQNMNTTSSFNTVRFDTSNGMLRRFSSTIDIKQDIVSIKPILEYRNERSLLHDLRPVLFHEKDQADGSNHTRGEYLAGMIAEEVLEVAPELCYYDHNGKLTSYGIEALIPHIVAELQRLSPMVETLYAKANPDWVAPVPRPASSYQAERARYDEAAAAQAVKGPEQPE